MTTTDIVSRIKEWLESLWGDPAAAAEFAESPATSLAGHDLSLSDLDGVDLRTIAGGYGGSSGISPEGRYALNQYSHSSPAAHVTPVQEVAYVTREVHQNNPTITKIFQDNSVNIDNSQTFINTGIVNGDITFDNDVTVASGDGAVALAEGAEGVIASGDGAVAAGGDANIAGPGAQIIQDSEIGNNANNSDGAILADEVAGANTGIIDDGVVSGGGVEDTIVGDDNVQVNPDGDGKDDPKAREEKAHEDKAHEDKAHEDKAHEDKAHEDKAHDGELPFGEGAGHKADEGTGKPPSGDELGHGGEPEAEVHGSSTDPSSTDPSSTDPGSVDPTGDPAADLPDSAVTGNPPSPQVAQVSSVDDGALDDQLMDA